MIGKSSHVNRLHFGLAVAEGICLSAFVLELSRALAGNTLSWAYVAEWPVLGVYAIYMWRKLLREDEPTVSPGEPPATPVDPRWVAFNEYLAKVHAEDQSPPEED